MAELAALATASDPRGELATPVLEARNISKRFPGSLALDSVDFDLRAGEVHALCGENGAGKSTLARILAGNVIPDQGELFFEGQIASFRRPIDAKKKGILLIHQELSLVPELTVAENIYLGNLPAGRFGRIDRRALSTKVDNLLSEFRCGINSTDTVGELSVAKRQMVEIARAAAHRCSVVIFDEPTASLTEDEAEILFANIRKLQSAGTGIIYISHKMQEIFRMTDRITVLRDGAGRGSLDTKSTNEDDITRLMIGRSLKGHVRPAAKPRGDEVLRIEDLAVAGSPAKVSLSVHKHEIVGLYGLIGAGRSELVEALFGIRGINAGDIYWCGRKTEIGNCRAAMDLGIALVPEDRKREGLVLGMSVRENITLPIINRLQRLGFLNSKGESAVYDEYKQCLSIKVANSEQHASTLSGGNQQKVVIGKWLASGPKLLILDEPTRGIDVGAKLEIHRLIADLANSGLAVLVISSEMLEIMSLSHRVLTMYQGAITGEFRGPDITEDNLIAAITGHTWSGSPEPV